MDYHKSGLASDTNQLLHEVLNAFQENNYVLGSYKLQKAYYLQTQSYRNEKESSYSTTSEERIGEIFRMKVEINYLINYLKQKLTYKE